MCKGSTADSDSVCLGSNPSSAANGPDSFGAVFFEVWRSLVARFVRDEEVAGSNPVTSTSMSVHNGFTLWTLILYSISSDLYVVSRFCACSLLFMRVLLVVFV